MTAKQQLLDLAGRATRMAGEAHKRGDYLACARLQATGRRYRDRAYVVGPAGPISAEEYGRRVSS